MGHIGIQDCYYNQTPMGKYVTQNYLKRLGLENVKSFATRGVIIVSGQFPAEFRGRSVTLPLK